MNKEHSVLVTSQFMHKICMKRIMGYACRQTSEMACNVVDKCMLHELQLEEKDIPGAKLMKDPSE